MKTFVTSGLRSFLKDPPPVVPTSSGEMIKPAVPERPIVP